MDKQVYSLKEIKETLLPILVAYPIRKAILFGSYAKGIQTPQSDVDLIIDSNGKIRGIDFFGVLEEMTNALRVPVDLLEASQIVSGGKVQKEIESSGVVIYERT